MSTKKTNGTKGEKELLTCNVDFDTFYRMNKDYFDLCHAVYNAIVTTWLRNLEDNYEGDRWFVMCEGTDIITNELGDIIRESDGEIIAHIDVSEHAVVVSYADIVRALGGTAEKIYVSQ